MKLIPRLPNTISKPFIYVFAFVLLCSHDLYIKMETYFLKPNQEVTLNLYNGTFEKSENVITRDRMLDASLVYGGNRKQIDESQWTDKDTTITRFTFTPTEEGTYVTGVSTKARNIELTAEKFNSYLEHDGVLDMLEYRKTNGLLDQDAVESYQKHVKAIYQVGNTKTDDWKTVLGYPIEFVPQENPYDSYSGETFEVKLFLDGKPLTNQLVFANYISKEHSYTHNEKTHDHKHKDKNHENVHAHDGDEHSHEHKHDDKAHSHDHDSAENHSHEHSHEHDDKAHSHKHESTNDHSHSHKHDGEEHSHDHKHEDEHTHSHESASDEGHTHTSGQQLRTNAEGVVTVDLPEDGIYYLRTIFMESVTDSDELTHQSKWATLTFEVTHKHGESTHTHEEDDHHHHDDGIPTWVFILGSLVVIGVLFFLFRKKQ